MEDYLRAGSPQRSPADRDIVLSYVAARPGLTLDELLQLTKDQVGPDQVYAMIAGDILRVDWRAAPFAEPVKVEVFAAAESASPIKNRAFRASVPLSQTELECGAQINWDGCLWSVVNLGDTSVSLLSADYKLTEIPALAFQSLVNENRVTVLASNAARESNPAARDRLSRASESDLKVATHRSNLVRRYFDNGTLPSKVEAPERTFFRWLDQYRKAEAAYGNGFLGLLPRFGERGNRAPKLPEASRRLIHEHIERDYETLKHLWIEDGLGTDAGTLSFG
jgi:putative transposase